MSRQNELDADPKAIQQIEVVEQLKKPDFDNNATDARDNDQSMLVLMIFEKTKETGLKFSEEIITIL